MSAELMGHTIRRLAAEACWIAGGLLATGLGLSLHARSPAASPDRLVSTVPTTRPRGVNPHWRRDGCQYCHLVEGDLVRPVAPHEVDGVCLRCHDGVRAKGESHPIGRRFEAPDVVLPAGWPAAGGRLGCATCHDTQSGMHRPHRPEKNAFFLRDCENGSLLKFCAKCHVPQMHRRFNPHVMLREDGEALPQVCGFCHRGPADQRNRTARLGEAELRGDEVGLCGGCHTRHLEWFEPGHVGVKVRPEMKAYMIAREAVAETGGALPASQAVRSATDGREPTRLPLGPGDRIVCSTCHNPHQEGVFPKGSVLSCGALPGTRRAAPAPLRGLGKDICIGCHNK